MSNGIHRVAPSKGTPVTTDATVGDASAQLIAANDNRRLLIIQNTHASNDLHLGFGVNATTSMLKVAAGRDVSFKDGYVPTCAVNGIASGAGTTVVIVEG